MRKNILIGLIVIIAGLLIAFGPQLLFKVCDRSCCCDEMPRCHWSAQAEIGIGLLLVSMGICFFVFPDTKTHIGLLLGVFFASIVAFFIPYSLIGGCNVSSMACVRVAFPALAVQSILLVSFSIIMLILIGKQTINKNKCKSNGT